METISISLNEEIIRAFGIDAVQKFIEEELSYQKFRLLEKKLQPYFTGLSPIWEKEYQTSRETAYQEYKQNRLNI
jgi:hypothetical protein